MPPAFPQVRPQAMLEAKDLPTCQLSQYLEQRMQRALEHERVERAKATGRNISDTAPINHITIRVINSIMKKCEVKAKMVETYASDNYPTEFSYRQKVLLLFQVGAGVALLGLWVLLFQVTNGLLLFAVHVHNEPLCVAVSCTCTHARHPSVHLLLC